MTTTFIDLTYDLTKLSATTDDSCLVVVCGSDRKLSPAGKHVNKAYGEVIDKAFRSSSFKGKKGQTLSIPLHGAPFGRLAVLGVGDVKDMKPQDYADLGGDLFALLDPSPLSKVSVILEDDVDAAVSAPIAAAHLAEGFWLRAYKFDKYKSKNHEEDPREDITFLCISTPNAQEATSRYDELRARKNGAIFTRNLVSEVPNVLYPASMAERLEKLSDMGIKVTVLTRKEMEKLGMNSLLAVGQGSDREERLVCLEWHGGVEGEKPLAFVGKGVTFDTGGISLKPGLNMHQMKWDMGGSAVVAGLLASLAARKAKVNAVGVVGLVENMPSGKATRPGDVVTAMSGTTIEILNTDAEGRLVLADALWYTQETYNPKLIVDLATLTGAILVSLGNEFAGLFANDKELAKQLFMAGEEVDEKVWEMPMHKCYDSHIKSDVADIKNLGKNNLAGSIAGAKFLEKFIKKGTPWAHMDIAGVTWADAPGHLHDKGATGFGVRLLDTFVKRNYDRAEP